MSKYNDALESMVELIDAQHSCGENTCTYCIGREHGHYASAIDFMVGAGPDWGRDFDVLYRKYGGRIGRDMQREVAEFCDIPHVECAECGAVVWSMDRNNIADDAMCSSCGANITNKRGVA